ncbi:MAG: hypothetical protein ACI9BF_000889 [Candidatus Paceibacteria bacterium]|jgi:hypothetical protein
MPYTLTVDIPTDDPSRVVDLFKTTKNMNKNDLLNDNTDVSESVRMVNYMAKGGFFAFTLNEIGLDFFSLREEEKLVPGTRFPYFVNECKEACGSGNQFFWGQFLFELINTPENTLNMDRSCRNLIYIREKSAIDMRVESYDFLSSSEALTVLDALCLLAVDYRDDEHHSKVIQRMISSLTS